MDKIELGFLADKKLITDVTYIDFYKDPKNKEALKKLTKAKLVDDEMFTQVGYLNKYFTFEIIALNGEGKLCEDCIVYINDKPGVIDFVEKGSEVRWKVQYKGTMSNEIIEPSIIKDTILVITVSGTDNKTEVKKEDKPIPEELY